jgi:hypothetical protein
VWSNQRTDPVGDLADASVLTQDLITQAEAPGDVAAVSICRQSIEIDRIVFKRDQVREEAVKAGATPPLNSIWGSRSGHSRRRPNPI